MYVYLHTGWWRAGHINFAWNRHWITRWWGKRSTELRQELRGLLEKPEALSLSLPQAKFLHPPWGPAMSPSVPGALLWEWPGRQWGLQPAWQHAPPHQASACIAVIVIWNKEMHLLMTLPLLHFFFTYFCILLFLFYFLCWCPLKGLLRKSSQQLEVTLKTEPWQELNTCSSTGKKFMVFISGRLQIC